MVSIIRTTPFFLPFLFLECRGAFLNPREVLYLTYSLYIQYYASLDGRRSYIIITRFKCQQAKITLLGTYNKQQHLWIRIWMLKSPLTFRYLGVYQCRMLRDDCQKRPSQSIHPFNSIQILVTCWFNNKRKHSLICISRRVVCMYALTQSENVKFPP